jgi:plastocyanin domain-containing protein
VKPTGVTKRISLGVSGSSYDPAVITVSKGDTVILEGDMTRLLGCDRSFVIPGYGIRKTFQTGDNVLQFVADKAGTFPFSCSMGMYTGTLVVQ